MGLGKTLQAISVAYYFRNDWPLLIIVPSSLRYCWIEEIEKWLPDVHPHDINLIRSGNDASGIASSQISIVTYGLLSKQTSHIVREALTNQKFQVIICDESHYIKNTCTASSKAVVPLVKNASHRLLLSGTPALAKPVELFPQIDALYPGGFGSWWQFTTRYCDARVEWIGRQKVRKVDGASNLEELQSKLASSIMIRREKKDVLKQLPPKQRQKVLFELKDSNLKKEILNLFEELKPILKAKTMSAVSLELDAATSVKDTEEPKGETLHRLSLISKLYRLSGEAKIGPVKEYVEMLCENRNLKFLVFAYHHVMMNGIQQTLYDKHVKFIRIDGETNPEDRLMYVQQFQSDPDIKVAILSILAAGVGLTLTAAKLVVFAEMYWTPGVMVQCEDRAHRIGQTASLPVHYLVAKGTMDEWVWGTVCRKTIVTSTALSGQGQKLEADKGDKYQIDILSSADAWVPSQDEDINFQALFQSQKPNDQKSILDFFTPPSKLKSQQEQTSLLAASGKKRQHEDDMHSSPSCKKRKQVLSTKGRETTDDLLPEIIMVEADDELDFKNEKPKKRKFRAGSKDFEEPVGESISKYETPKRGTGFELCDSSSSEKEGKKDSQQWACTACTFLNHSELLRCEMCNTPSKMKTRQKQKRRADNSGNSLDQNKTVSTSVKAAESEGLPQRQENVLMANATSENPQVRENMCRSDSIEREILQFDDVTVVDRELTRSPVFSKKSSRISRALQDKIFNVSESSAKSRTEVDCGEYENESSAKSKTELDCHEDENVPNSSNISPDRERSFKLNTRMSKEDISVVKKQMMKSYDVNSQETCSEGRDSEGHSESPLPFEFTDSPRTTKCQKRKCFQLDSDSEEELSGHGELVLKSHGLEEDKLPEMKKHRSKVSDSDLVFTPVAHNVDPDMNSIEVTKERREATDSDLTSTPVSQRVSPPGSPSSQGVMKSQRETSISDLMSTPAGCCVSSPRNSPGLKQTLSQTSDSEIFSTPLNQRVSPPWDLHPRDSPCFTLELESSDDNSTDSVLFQTTKSSNDSFTSLAAEAEIEVCSSPFKDKEHLSFCESTEKYPSKGETDTSMETKAKSDNKPEMRKPLFKKSPPVKSLKCRLDQTTSGKDEFERLGSITTDEVDDGRMNKQKDQEEERSGSHLDSESVPEHKSFLYCVSLHTGRVYLFDQNGGRLNENFLPLDVEMGNTDQLPPLLHRHDNLRHAQKFVREWNSLSETKKRLITKRGMMFFSPLAAYDEVRSGKVSNTQRHKTKEDMAAVALQTADNRNGAVRRISRRGHSGSKDESRSPQPTESGKGVLQAVTSEGVPLCLNCQRPYENSLLKKSTITDDRNAWQTRLCSADCMDQYWIQTHSSYCREKLYEVEHGVCQMCKFDAHGFFRQIRDNSDLTQRAKRVGESKFSRLTAKQKEMMVKKPVQGQFWHVDHITPVWEGGGMCDIDNMRTLCVICHQKVTAGQARKRAVARRLRGAAAGANITAFFQKL